MNKVVITGNACADAKITYTQDSKKIGKVRIAVRRPFARQDADTDFINCTGFEKKAEFMEKHVKKGVKFEIAGRLQIGSYKKQDGTTVYTTDVIIEEIGFAESKKAAEPAAPAPAQEPAEDWMLADDISIPFM